jgi:hypothetical protein
MAARIAQTHSPVEFIRRAIVSDNHDPPHISANNVIDAAGLMLP